MKKFACFVLGLFAVSAIHSAELRDIVPADVCNELLQKKQITHLHYDEKNYVLNLRPNTKLAQELTNVWKSKDKPVFVIEKLLLLEKSEFSQGSSLKIQDISEALRGFSTMKGVQYYSNTRKQVETLYTDSYTYENGNSSKRVKDNTSGSADGLELYCMNEDHSLGKCYYSVNFRQTQDELSALFTLVEPVKYGPITAVAPENLQITIDVVDCGEQMAVFMFFEAKFPTLAIFSSKLTKSFTARVDAIYSWLSDQISKK